MGVAVGGEDDGEAVGLVIVVGAGHVAAEDGPGDKALGGGVARVGVTVRESVDRRGEEHAIDGADRGDRAGLQDDDR